MPTEIAMRHGQRLAAELGIDLTEATFDPDAFKASLGIDPAVESLTYKDVQQRRDEIRQRVEDVRRPGKGDRK